MYALQFGHVWTTSFIPFIKKGIMQQGMHLEEKESDQTK
jgi:hypothetical protein